MPYPIARAFLYSWFPLCHCISENPAKFIWVLMAGNCHLIVIWEDSFPQTAHLIPLFLDQHHNLWLQLWCIPQQWWEDPGRHAYMNESLLVLSCASQHSCPLPSSICSSGFGVNEESRWSLLWLPFLSITKRWRQSSPSPGPGHCALPCALRALHVGANSLIIGCNRVDYLTFLFRGCQVFLMVFLFAYRQPCRHCSLVSACFFLFVYKVKRFWSNMVATENPHRVSLDE